MAEHFEEPEAEENYNPEEEVILEGWQLVTLPEVSVVTGGQTIYIYHYLI